MFLAFLTQSFKPYSRIWIRTEAVEMFSCLDMDINVHNSIAVKSFSKSTDYQRGTILAFGRCPDVRNVSVRKSHEAIETDENFISYRFRSHRDGQRPEVPASNKKASLAIRFKHS